MPGRELKKNILDYRLFLDGFDPGVVMLRVGFWGRARIIFDGTDIPCTNGSYILKTSKGYVVPLRLKRRFLDPVPVVQVGMLPIHVVTPFKWFEYLWVIGLVVLSLGLGIWMHSFEDSYTVIGSICFFVGVPLVFFSFRIFRSRMSPMLKYLTTSGLAVLVYLAISVTLILFHLTVAIASNVEIDKQYEKILKISEQEEIHGNNHNLKVDTKLVPVGTSVDQFGMPMIDVDVVRIRSLLRSGKYAELDSVLDSFQKLFEKDFHFEDAASQAFRAFAIPDSTLSRFLRAWVRTEPNRYQPYLARGAYEEAMGWESRGRDWAKNTPDENFEKMSDYFADSKSDIFQALTIESHLMVAYELLMDISRAESDKQVSELLITAGLKLCPYVYRLRERYMMGLTPRWGGSYRTMELFARESEKFAHYNPKLKILYALILSDQANLSYLDSNSEASIQLYTKALSIGESPIFYHQRGNDFLDLNKYQEALSDFEKADALSPRNPDILFSKAWALAHLGDLSYSSQLLDSTVLLDPRFISDVDNLRKFFAHKTVLRGYALHEQHHDAEAIPVFNDAAAFYPEDAEAYYYRGVSYAELRQWNEAATDVEKAISYDPHNASYYGYLDWVLTQTGNWATIADYWGRLISLEPENARAYLYRAGAFYHQGDLESALKDAQKSCDLAKGDGCDAVKKLESQLKTASGK